MQLSDVEKRKFPRLDTSNTDEWVIRIYGVRGNPVEGNIINLSLGGLAFIGQWKKVARTIKRDTSKIEIILPTGKVVEADSTLLRVLPKMQNDKCECAMLFSELNLRCKKHLEHYMPDQTN